MVHLPVREFRTAAEYAASLWFLTLVTAGISWVATTVVSLFTFLALAMFVFVLTMYAGAATIDTGQKAYVAAMHFLNGPDLGHTDSGHEPRRSAGLVRKVDHGRVSPQATCPNDDDNSTDSGSATEDDELR